MTYEQANVTQEPTYSLDLLQVSLLCEQMLLEKGIDQQGVPANPYVGVRIEEDSPYANIARYVEAEVFGEEFMNGSELLSEEYGPYESNSVFLTVIDIDKKIPVGVMRILDGSKGRLKSLDDLDVKGKVGLGFSKQDVVDGYQLDHAQVADIATLAVLKDYRGQKMTDQPPTFLLYRMLYKEFLDNPNFDHTITMMDKRAERVIRLLSFPFEPVFNSDYFSYLGSPETRFLIANNAKFYSEIKQGAELKLAEAADSGSEVKRFLGEAALSFINPSGLDKVIY